ncbi:glycosyltransferase family 9 protein [Novacetimonas pomaceti]|uniref:ADP-heptose--LPS heptosyltransferase n=1 Tax=Novacetimonas pomaceti TaxID=2021998 RepID=A0A318QEX3_9PROT|nr:glycosyltransferase family 9 protein [Novacetimonas pomaceti]PYD47443.1 ADP-heptose--LPS heptosyltransferase [Novacetimonas pomaceti]PYD76021.1 ADP-heptose--LPS heptosyltransferase [Novacetimonas pomaceti]
MQRILVIRLSALGDFVQSFAPFAAIREHHRHDSVTLLTTAPFVELARASPWFDHVEVDPRAPWYNLRAVMAMRGLLRRYDFIYDLQTSRRTTRYFHLSGHDAWSGIAPGARARHDNPQRQAMHNRARQRDQLRRAGIAEVPEPDLSWLAAYGPRLPGPYALLVPGTSPRHPVKRWPVERFAGLASRLWARGLRPVVVGGRADAPLAAAISAACDATLDLTGRTSLLELGGIAARAAVAVGNDTGPMHLAAAMGAPCVVLFSRAGDPALSAPMGCRPGQVRVLWARDLATLHIDRVAAALG